MLLIHASSMARVVAAEVLTSAARVTAEPYVGMYDYG
jgi:hypothetical protein